MVTIGICLALLLFGLWYSQWDNERPIDEDELRFLRRMSDRNRAEEEIFH